MKVYQAVLRIQYVHFLDRRRLWWYPPVIAVPFRGFLVGVSCDRVLCDVLYDLWVLTRGCDRELDPLLINRPAFRHILKCSFLRSRVERGRGFEF